MSVDKVQEVVNSLENEITKIDGNIDGVKNGIIEQNEIKNELSNKLIDLSEKEIEEVCCSLNQKYRESFLAMNLDWDSLMNDKVENPIGLA